MPHVAESRRHSGADVSTPLNDWEHRVVVSAPLDDQDFYVEHRFFLMLH